MILSDVEARLVPWYLASVKDGGASKYLVSKPGLGKSSVLSLAKDKLNAYFPGKKYGFKVVNGATMSLTRATGYLMPFEKDGKRYTDFTIPDWYITDEGLPLDAYTGGVILVDEIDKMGIDEKKIFGEAALSKVLGAHRLPPGWVVWFAGNYTKDRSGSTKDLDHLINRRQTIHVTPDILSTVNWMDKNGCLPETKTFAQEYSQIVFMDPPEEQGPWCTPRSLAQADAHLRSLMEYTGGDTISVDALTTEELAGGIGKAAAASYIGVIRMGQELPPYELIIANPIGAPVAIKPDARRLTAYSMAAKVLQKDMSPMLAYISRLPEEFQMLFGKSLMRRDNRFVINPAFEKWCYQHKDLVELMSKLR